MALPALFQNAAAVTLHDTNENKFDALYIGGAGNLAVRTLGGQDVTFNGLVAGTILYVKVVLVKSTGSTATNVVGLR